MQTSLENETYNRDHVQEYIYCGYETERGVSEHRCNRLSISL
jgi:hypothetical protein